MSGSRILIDETRCSGCGRCVSACKNRLFSLELQGFRKVAILRPGHCDRCGQCVENCPVRALKI